MINALRRSVERTRVTPPKVNAPEGHVKYDFHKRMICQNGKDNVPETFVSGAMPYETAFSISQSRSPGHKDQGQDCMATARDGEWEVNVLCDGHDRDGHLVSRAVCDTLPMVVLRRIQARENPSKSRVEKALLIAAFEETSNEIAWTAEGVRTGMFVKVFGGPWDGKVGYVGDSTDHMNSVVIIVDADGYHRPVIENKALKRAKFTGGSTCICVLRNLTTNECRVAFTGDSRMLMIRKKMFDDTIVRPVYGLMSYDSSGKPQLPPLGLTTPAHNVFSKEELLRLNTSHAGSFEIDGAFLVNPVTKFAIQPTRGFGDFDMFGTGYTNVPEVSESFKLEEGTFLFAASDGVFDEHVWKDDELVSFFAGLLDKGCKTQAIAEEIYKETLERSLAGGYVDDISLFCFLTGPPQPTTCTPKSAPASSPGSRQSMSQKKGLEEGFAAMDVSPRSSSSHGSAPDGRESGSKSLPNRASQRKSLLSGLWKGRKSASSLEIDESLLTSKPTIDKPTPEDRRRTIQRKDKGSFSEISSMLKEAIAKQSEEQQGGAQDNRELADIILKRYASQHGHNPDDVHTGLAAHKDAARVGARLSKERGKR